MLRILGEMVIVMGLLIMLVLFLKVNLK
jgi:hypothetical protein